MGNYHAQMMNITTERNAVIEDDLAAAGVTTTVTAYNCGHRDARHAAAEIANEADQRIEELEAKLAAANQRIAALESELENARAAADEMYSVYAHAD